MDTPSHPSITLSSEQRVENGVVYTDDVARQRAIAYDMLREFSAKRAAYYRDSSKINLRKLLGKDVIMFAARGVATAEEFVLEAFRACESSSEETVMGNLWQALICCNLFRHPRHRGHDDSTRRSPLRMRAQIAGQHHQFGVVPPGAPRIER